MILFVTRKFPPATGGMEKLSYELIDFVSRKRKCIKVVWGGSQKWLPFVYLYLLIKSFFVALIYPVKIIHLGDPVLSPIGVFLRFVFRKPVVVNIHGLDVTYQNNFYQFIVPKCLKKMDLLIAISDQTKSEITKRGIEEKKVKIITPGVDKDDFPILINNNNFQPLYDLIGLDITDKIVLLTVGRLVQRKGVLFFIKEVLPKLGNLDKYIYLVCGLGPDFNVIKDFIIKNDLNDKVFLTGRISKDILDLAYRRADIFVMPNIPVKGDMEGFGLVALEACMYALPVVASDLEGIKNAIFDKKNGFLVKPKDYQNFGRIITRLAEDKKGRKELGLQARNFVMEEFNWDRISDQYIQYFDNLK